MLDAPEESVHIAFGILLEGKGQAWLSDVHFEEVGPDITVTGISTNAPSREYPDNPGNLDFAT